MFNLHLYNHPYRQSVILEVYTLSNISNAYPLNHGEVSQYIIVGSTITQLISYSFYGKLLTGSKT